MRKIFGFTIIALLCVSAYITTRAAMTPLVIQQGPVGPATCTITGGYMNLEGFTIDGVPYDADDRIINGITLDPGDHTVQVTWYNEIECGAGNGMGCGVCVESRVYQFNENAQEIIPNFVPYEMSNYTLVAECGQSGQDVSIFTFTIHINAGENGDNTNSYVVAGRRHSYNGTKCDGTCPVYGGEISFSFVVPSSR